MSRRDEFIAERLKEEEHLTRREAMNRHHTIRHNHEPPPRKGVSPLLFMLLVFALIMVTSTMNRSGKGEETAPDRTTPQWQQMLSIATIMSEGSWGSELLDSCFLLMEDFAEAGELSASRYMLLLASGAQPDYQSEKLIATIAANEQEAEIYRQALEASYQNMLRLSQSSVPAQKSP